MEAHIANHSQYHAQIMLSAVCIFGGYYLQNGALSKTQINHASTSDESTTRRPRAADIVSGEFISRLPRRCPPRRLISACWPPVSP